MSRLYLLGFLLLISGQVNSAPVILEDIQSIYTEFEQWLSDKAHEFIRKVSEDGGNVHTILVSEIAVSKQKIENIASNAIDELNNHSLDKKCLVKGLESIKLAREATIWEFFHCSNLSEAITDVGKLIHETFDITKTILGYFEYAAAGLSECIQGNYIDDLACANAYIWNVVKNIRDSIPGVANYEKNVTALAATIKDDIEYCETAPSDAIKSQVKKILIETKQCKL